MKKYIYFALLTITTLQIHTAISEKYHKPNQTLSDQLQMAINSGDTKKLKSLYAKNPKMFTAKITFKNLSQNIADAQLNPLMYATYTMNNKAIPTLLSFKEVKDNINAQDGYNNTALMIAIEVNNGFALIELLKAGANPNIGNKRKTPLKLASELNNNFIKLLELYGAK